MKKSLIALSIAAMSTAAFAQSSVQVYGIMDAAMLYQKGSDGRHVTSVASGGLSASRIGFKGTEDLGGGNAAVFTIEEGFNLDSNASTFSHRQTFVGLQSKNYGTVALGRQNSPGHNISGNFDAVAAGSAFSAGQILSSMSGSTIAVGSNGRWNNAIGYTSPVMNGFEVAAMYRAGEQISTTATTDSTTLSGYGVSGKYTTGPLAVGYAFQRTESSVDGSGAANTGVQNEQYVGASYDFGAAKVLGSYQTAKFTANGGGNEGRNNQWTIGTIVPVTGKTAIHANYSALTAKNDVAADGRATSTTVAAVHSLSKRTALYALANVTTVGNDMVIANYTGTAAATQASNVLTSQLVNGTTLGVGMRHSF
jgi:predicted porin